jgi:hypothetical protein
MNSRKWLPFKHDNHNWTTSISNDPLAVRVQQLSRSIFTCKPWISNVSHNFTFLIPPPGRARHHFSLIFVISKSKHQVLRRMTQVWILRFRCVHSLLMNMPETYFGQTSPLTGTLALFLWEGWSLCIYPTLEALCPAVFISHFYSCYVWKGSLMALEFDYTLQDHCHSQKLRFTRVAR